MHSPTGDGRSSGDGQVAETSQKLLALARQAHSAGRDEDAEVLAEARWRLDGFEMPASKHSGRMDSFRAMFCAALIVALAVVILVGLFKGQNGEQISQLAAPISGLAGIGIGWLFSGASSSRD
jgi:hypothetical protein